MSELYIGLMSGTSMDAIDATLVDIKRNAVDVIACHTHPYPDSLRDTLQSLTRTGRNELNTMMSADVQLGRLFAEAANQLLSKAGVRPIAVKAIGSHGQTLRHVPTGETPTTLQIGDPNIIAQNTGITTIADFRRRDMAAGGQGAPLVPAFHDFFFGNAATQRVVVNIGGIANITILSGNNRNVSGFDTGPGNVLMDQWIAQCENKPYDNKGSWASSGKPMPELLKRLRTDAYFRKSPPKSTGTDYFNLKWLEKKLKQHGKRTIRKNVQATLCELTAETIHDAIREHAADCKEVIVCGGGAHNLALLFRLQSLLQPVPVRSSEDYGIDPDWVEAVAFAWLARQTLENEAGNLPSVTGAEQSVILGGIYKAGRL